MSDDRRKPPHPARRNLRYDRHADVVDDLDDACGATVLTTDDQLAARWLARSPVSRGR